MSGYSDGIDTYTYKYDANGIRTQKNDKQYVVDINNNVVAETDNTGTITDEVLWGHQPLARKVNGSWYYYIYNAHGDVVGLVNEAGTVVNTYEYTPWGEIRNESETVDNPIKYAGEYYDDELGMIYLRARYYNPKVGRFTSHDIEEGEISNPLDMNRYVYCRNNPIKYVDPTGKSATEVLKGAWSLGGTVASLDGLWYYGDIAGAAIGIIGTIVAGGIAIYKAATNNDKDSRLTGKPGDVNESTNTKTKIGSDGRASKERHYSDHGNPSKHTNPHDHDINWGPDGNPQFGPPINYPDGAPSFN